MESLKSGTKYDLVNREKQSDRRQLDARGGPRQNCVQAWKNESLACFSSTRTIVASQRECRGHGGPNPCVTGDTIVSTEQGLISIADLADRYPNGAFLS